MTIRIPASHRLLSLPHIRQNVRRCPPQLLAGILMVLICGCGSGPSISTEKAADLSGRFAMYADALDRVGTRWELGLDAEEVKTVHAELATVSEALRAEASGVKTDAMIERVEGLGSALTSVPTPWTKAAGWILLAGAGLFGLTRKKKTSVEGVGR